MSFFSLFLSFLWNYVYLISKVILSNTFVILVIKVSFICSWYHVSVEGHYDICKRLEKPPTQKRSLTKSMDPFNSNTGRPLPNPEKMKALYDIVQPHTVERTQLFFQKKLQNPPKNSWTVGWFLFSKEPFFHYGTTRFIVCFVALIFRCYTLVCIL